MTPPPPLEIFRKIIRWGSILYTYRAVPFWIGFIQQKEEFMRVQYTGRDPKRQKRQFKRHSEWLLLQNSS